MNLNISLFADASMNASNRIDITKSFSNASPVYLFDSIVIDLDSHVCTYKEKGLKTVTIAAPPQYRTNNEDNLKI